jgi:hypothetical protein
VQGTRETGYERITVCKEQERLDMKACERCYQKMKLKEKKAAGKTERLFS